VTTNRRKQRGLLALFVFGALSFCALGIWQVQRLGWKRDLIARVEARIHAQPVQVPVQHRWTAPELREAEYRRVQVRGTFMHDRETLVDALTELGPGAWVLTPLRTAEGTILVNRGFVPPERRDPRTRAGQAVGEVTVTGLLRLSEPDGRILRPNDAKSDRWFSRDVEAIARARALGAVAPFFIDAEAEPVRPDGAPVGGLTVVRFRNAHLSYAATWFALAALCAAGIVVAARR